MKKALKYILIWLLPAALLCTFGYEFVRSGWIFFFGEGKFERLEGATYLFIGMIHAAVFFVTSVVALIITLRIRKKPENMHLTMK